MRRLWERPELSDESQRFGNIGGGDRKYTVANFRDRFASAGDRSAACIEVQRQPRIGIVKALIEDGLLIAKQRESSSLKLQRQVAANQSLRVRRNQYRIRLVRRSNFNESGKRTLDRCPCARGAAQLRIFRTDVGRRIARVAFERQ